MNASGQKSYDIARVIDEELTSVSDVDTPSVFPYRKGSIFGLSEQDGFRLSTLDLDVHCVGHARVPTHQMVSHAIRHTIHHTPLFISSHFLILPCYFSAIWCLRRFHHFLEWCLHLRSTDREPRSILSTTKEMYVVNIQHVPMMKQRLVQLSRKPFSRMYPMCRVSKYYGTLHNSLWICIEDYLNLIFFKLRRIAICSRNFVFFDVQ